MKTKNIVLLFLFACGNNETAPSTNVNQGAAVGNATDALSTLEKHPLPEGRWVNVFATADARTWVLESSADDLYTYSLDGSYAGPQLQLLPMDMSAGVVGYDDVQHGWKIEVVHTEEIYRMTWHRVHVYVKSLADDAILAEAELDSVTTSTFIWPEFGGVVSPALVGKVTLKGNITKFHVTADDSGNPVINVLKAGENVDMYETLGGWTAQVTNEGNTIALSKWTTALQSVTFQAPFNVHSLAPAGDKLALIGGPDALTLDTLAFINLPQ